MRETSRMGMLGGLLVAVTMAGTACSGKSLHVPAGRDAGADSLDVGHDTVETRTDVDVGQAPADGRESGADGMGPDRNAEDAATDTLGGSEDGPREGPRETGRDTLVPSGPDARDVSDAPDDTGRGRDMPSSEAGLDVAPPDRRLDDAAPDLPIPVDTSRPDTRAQDTVPTLELLAGGLGGMGMQDGTGAGARFCLPTGMVLDGQGKLFVADYCNHVIREVSTATGTVTTLAGTAQEAGFADGVGADARFAVPAGIASDGQGNLFVTDSGTHVIRKIVIATRTVSTVAGVPGESGSADGIGSAARFSVPRGILHDGAGALYISDNATIRKLTLATGAVTTVAGQADVRGNRDGIGSAAQFSYPQGIALDGAGGLVVADTDNQAIRKVVLATAEVTTVDRTTFARPNALASDGHGVVYVVDGSDHTFRRLVLATGSVSLIAGDVTQAGADDGTGTAARFCDPKGVVLDGAGNAFVADAANHLLRKVVLATAVVTTLAGRAKQSGHVDGTAERARFDFQGAAGLASDGQGHLFVTDTSNQTIRKIVIATAEVTTFAGGVAECDMVDGAGKNARFCSPTAIASDGIASLFVADTANHAIRKIALATAEVTTLAGYPGAPGSSDGVRAAARFNEPMGIAADAAGNVYVADTQNSTLRQIVVASGTVTTLAGAAGMESGDDGIGTRARFRRPSGLALDGFGNLFVADADNNTIRKIVLATTTVTTLAGTPENQGNEDGIGPAATFSGVRGLALDGMGSLFVADMYGRTVRQVALDTASVTTAVGSSHRLGVVPGALPASLNGPVGLAFVAPGDLFITDGEENAVLRARF